MAVVVLVSFCIILQAISVRADEASSLLDDIQEKLAMKRERDDGGGSSLERSAEVLRRSDDNSYEENDLSLEQSEERLIRMLAEKRYHKHCGPQRLGEFCRSSHDCCCGFHCRQFKCREHFFG